MQYLTERVKMQVTAHTKIKGVADSIIKISCSPYVKHLFTVQLHIINSVAHSEFIHFRVSFSLDYLSITDLREQVERSIDD
jgi:hypothetical protein